MGDEIMNRRTILKALTVAGVIPELGVQVMGATPVEPGVFELRVYTAAEGKLDDLLKRFREHTTKLFERHGMKNVAYWTTTDEPRKSNTLIYILKHPSREAATTNWKAFQDDPEWQQVRNKSEEGGKLVEKVDSTFMVLTDFSAKV
jgi:hypothetical protein